MATTRPAPKDYVRRKPQAERHRRTIAKELLETWRALERKGDAYELPKILGVSKPTIDKALIYGCCHQQAIIDGINKYFADRLMKERDTAQQLNALVFDGKAA